jgi:hypothetical protein
MTPAGADFHTFDLGGGSVSGLLCEGGVLSLAADALDTVEYVDPFADANGDGVDGSGEYRFGTWTSDVRQVPFDELVASWNATTPPGTWLQAEVQPQLGDGRWVGWYVLGRWAYGDEDFHRTSVGGQGGADGDVAIDTFVARQPAAAYRLRLTLHARVGSRVAAPSVRRSSAVASSRARRPAEVPSATTMTGTAVELDVPRFSQEVHRGEYPQFDCGGEAWCSPAATAMVVAYWDALFPQSGYAPSPAETAWVNPRYADPCVDHAARFVFDYHYGGAGNWSFNAAYAAGRGLVADVTRLASLRDAEALLADGIPLVVSVAYTPRTLGGATVSTKGHLVVLAGFSGDGGTVLVNDPAAPTNAEVGRSYERAQLERAWLSASGGLAYVIRPAP